MQPQKQSKALLIPGFSLRMMSLRYLSDACSSSPNHWLRSCRRAADESSPLCESHSCNKNQATSTQRNNTGNRIIYVHVQYNSFGKRFNSATLLKVSTVTAISSGGSLNSINMLFKSAANQSMHVIKYIVKQFSLTSLQYTYLIQHSFRVHNDRLFQ